MSEPVVEPGRADQIEVRWPDGLHQVWEPAPDGSWTLRVTDPNAPGPLPAVTGYDAPNICRVVTTAVTGAGEPAEKQVPPAGRRRVSRWCRFGFHLWFVKPYRGLGPWHGERTCERCGKREPLS